MPRVFINLHRLQALAREDEIYGGTRVEDFMDEKYGEVYTSRGRFRSSWNLSVYYKRYKHDTPHLTHLEVLSMMVLIKNAMMLFRIKLRFEERYDLLAAYLEICEGHMTWIYHLSNGTFQLIMRRL